MQSNRKQTSRCNYTSEVTNLGNLWRDSSVKKGTQVFTHSLIYFVTYSFNERERVYQEVLEEAKRYRDNLLEEKKTNIVNEVNEKYKELILPEFPVEIVMKNKIIEDEKIKLDYENKLKQDKERLEELRRMKNIEEITRPSAPVVTDATNAPERAQETTKKITFGMNKRRVL